MNTCVHVCTCMHMPAVVHVCRSEGKLWESSISFHHMGEGLSLVVGLSCRHLPSLKNYEILFKGW